MKNLLTRLTFKAALCLFGTVICLADLPHASAQVVPEFDLNSAYTYYATEELKRFRLNSMLPEAEPVYVQIAAKDLQGNELWKLTSGVFECPAGMLDMEQLRDKVRFREEQGKPSPVTETIRKTRYFPKGGYIVCISVRSNRYEGELGSNCRQIDVLQSPVTGDEQKPSVETQKKKGPVQFSGNSELTAYYSNMQYPGSVTPPAYLNWYLNPTVTVEGFPVSAQLFLSTQQQSGQQNLNRFDVSFDAEKFKSLLRERLVKYLQEQESLKKVTGMMEKANLSEYSSLDKVLNSEGVRQELSKIKILDSLQQQVDALTKLQDSIASLQRMASTDSLQGLAMSYTDSLPADTLSGLQEAGTDSMSARIDSLKEKIKPLAWLMEKKAVYDGMMAKKEKLQGYIKSAGLDTIDPGKIGEYGNQLSDPNFLFSKLKSNKLLRKGEELMYMVKSLHIGTSFPVNTDFTVNGSQLDGFSVALEKWNLYASFQYGRMRQGVQTHVSNYAAYDRDMIGGTFGYGQKEKTHFHISLYSFEDDPASIPATDSLFPYITRPKSNKVISADFRVQLLKKRLSIFGEIAGAQTIRDVSYADTNFTIINPATGANPDEWFTNIFTQRDIGQNAVTDFAVTAGMELQLPKIRNRITLSAKRVGANFYTLGNPYLMRDILMFEGKVNQSFWKNRIIATVFLRNTSNNLDQQLPVNMHMINVGFDLTVAIPKWPVMRAGAMPIVQSMDSVSYAVNLFNFMTSHQWRLKKKKVLAMALMLTAQDATSQGAGTDYFSATASLQHSLSFRGNLSLQLSNNYMYMNTALARLHTYFATASASATVLKVWTNSAGGSIYVNKNETRWGAFYQSGVSFLKLFALSVRVDCGQYDGTNLLAVSNSYSQVSARTILNVKW